jgi:hypothetical protein
MSQHEDETNIKYFEIEKLKSDFLKKFNIKSKDFSKYENEFSIYKADIIHDHYVHCCQGRVQCRILCTYDSFCTIKNILGESIKYFHVVVDEFQSIFLDSFFKANVENDFFATLQDVPNVAYLSATPMLEKYMERLEGFRDLPYYKLIWPNDRITTASVEERWVSSVIDEAKVIIDTYKNDPQGRPVRETDDGRIITSSEVVFYVNSVAMIKKIITESKLVPSEVNIICADTARNRKLIKGIRQGSLSQDDKFSIGDIPGKGKPHKMFTFCTRTAYLGADFYSTNAITVVLSDANVQSLVVDIRLDLPQILGRQRLRENPWKNECIVFYKTLDDGSQITKESFENNCKTKESLSRKLVQEKYSPNFFDTKEIDSLIESIFRENVIVNDGQTSVYLSKTRDGRIVYNEFLRLAEERAWELCQEDYKSNISVLRSLGESKYIEVNHYMSDSDYKVQAIIRKYRELPRFSDKFCLYCESREAYKDDPEITKRLLVYFCTTEFENYYSHFGIAACRAISFKESELKKKLEDESKENQLGYMIRQEFVTNKSYTLKDIKEKLRSIYSLLNLHCTPKATDILDYFNVQEKRVLDEAQGKRVRGYQIISIK